MHIGIHLIDYLNNKSLESVGTFSFFHDDSNYPGNPL